MRHQLPVYSPVTAGSLLRGALAAISDNETGETLASEVANRYAAGRVLLTDTGTQALNLAIRIATAAKNSPKVGLPAFCCYDLASAAVGADARISLYDVDPRTLTPDLNSVERLLKTTDTRVLVAVHLYGYPVEWDAMLSLAERYGAIVIEDAAQSHGGTWAGRPLGSLGGLSVLSFGRGKGWTGSGGGALLMRDEFESAAMPELLRAGGGLKRIITATAHWSLGRPSIYGIPASVPWLALGETHYHEPEPPRAIHALSSAIARDTSALATAEFAIRRQTAYSFETKIRAISAIELIEKSPKAEPGYLRFPVRLPAGLKSLPSENAALRAGIGRSYPMSIAKLPAVRDRVGDARFDISGADTLSRQLITLPVHSRLKEGDINAILDLLALARAN